VDPEVEWKCARCKSYYFYNSASNAVLVVYFSLFVLLFDSKECEHCESPAPARGNPSAVASEGLRLRPLVAAARHVSARHRNALFSQYTDY
jgi:hypothetical protein